MALQIEAAPSLEIELKVISRTRKEVFSFNDSPISIPPATPILLLSDVDNDVSKNHKVAKKKSLGTNKDLIPKEWSFFSTFVQ